MPIIEYRRQGVVAFKKPRKCPYCNCHFGTNVDLEDHISAIHWKTSGGGWELMPADRAPQIAQRLKVSGEFTDGAYVYRLSGDGSLIFRRRLI